CLKHHYPKADIRLVGGRRDLGIDIFAIAENDEPTIIQVKRRSRLLATEGVSTVRELNGVLFREGFRAEWSSHPPASFHAVPG
ncbi:restriction endonuclease, partial [Serratia marcescens]|uniref:restriction endonuclease n=1 Tax=Serratia marcescens TaxID=615 RepID=UPI0013D95416